MTNLPIVVIIVGLVLSVVLFLMSRGLSDAAARQANKRRAAMATHVTVGAALGATVGFSVDNMGLGVAIGVAVGVAIGAAREAGLR